MTPIGGGKDIVVLSNSELARIKVLISVTLFGKLQSKTKANPITEEQARFKANDVARVKTMSPVAIEHKQRIKELEKERKASELPRSVVVWLLTLLVQ